MSTLSELFGHPKDALNAELNRQKPKMIKAVTDAVGHAKAQGEDTVTDVLKDLVVSKIKGTSIFGAGSIIITTAIALIPIKGQSLDAFLTEATKRINGARF